MMQAGREVVGSGPVALPSATDEKAQKALDMLKVPLRFVSPKSRTVMAVPSNFDPICSIGNSNKVPGYDLVRYDINVPLPEYCCYFGHACYVIVICCFVNALVMRRLSSVHIIICE